MSPATLHRRREQRGWTQAALARQLGITIRSVSRWETGAVAIPVPMQKLLAMVLPAKSRNGARECSGAETVSLRRRPRDADAVERRGNPQEGAAGRAAPRRALLPGAAPRPADLQVAGHRRVDRERDGRKQRRQRRAARERQGD